MEAGVGDKETKRTKWRETRAATHSEQEQAKVNPRRENHFTAVTETTECEWWGPGCGCRCRAEAGEELHFPIATRTFTSDIFTV